MTSESVTIVTGGSRGIGRAIVEQLAAAGHRVAFTFVRDAEAAEHVVGGRVTVRAFQLDLADRARPSRLVEEVEAAFGPITALVNNAGVRRDGLLALTSDRDWDAVVETNLGGVFRCCRAVLKGMVVRRAGAIVNVSSLSALHGVAGQCAYAASKAGILGLTRALAREVGKRGIRVNAVLPGFVATDLTSGADAATVERLRAGECLPSAVTPDDVARTVRFLLSADAASITGQAIPVDGGASA